uniref:G_PROTEIN_RECEP_F1_2 domain-containing protein n=1 Tax=Strongyloides papillosus TaxID=174720 RepID=A0A0N5C4C0_STREA
MIGVGIISSLVAFLIISVSFQVFQGIYVFIFGISYLDCLLSLSIVYAGFYGLHIKTYYNGSNSMLPEECLYTAFFSIIWIIYDTGTFLLLFIKSLDRLIHSLTSVWHEVYQSYVMNSCSLVICIILSSLPVITIIQYPIEVSSNISTTISSNCYEKDVFGWRYYEIMEKFRFYNPMFNILIIFVVLIIYVIRKNIQTLHFANTAFDRDTNSITLIISIRSLLQLLICGLFTLTLSSSMINDYLFRCTQCFTFIIFQIFFNYFCLEKYKNAFNTTFRKYIKNTTRGWQSADDPPTNFINRSMHSLSSMFGSWYSAGGNIVGEAGVPRVDDFHRNLSVSFYYNDNGVVVDDINLSEFDRF